VGRNVTSALVVELLFQNIRDAVHAVLLVYEDSLGYVTIAVTRRVCRDSLISCQVVCLIESVFSTRFGYSFGKSRL